MKGQVSLSLPHYVCIKEDKNACDVSNYRLCKSFRQGLKDSGFLTACIVGNVNRREMDLNRDEALGSQWREELLKLARSSDFHIDFHTYGMKRRHPGWDKYVIVYMDPEPPKQKPLYEGLVCDLEKGSDYIKAFQKNSIVMQLTEEGISCALIEFLETMDGKTARKLGKNFGTGLKKWIINSKQ